MGQISLQIMTRELCHDLYKGWTNDASIYMDMKLFKPYTYNEDAVNRYFESKQVLFEAAVRRYVSDYCAPIVQALQAHRGDWEGGMACVTALFTKRDGEERYHSFFHKKENLSLINLQNECTC